MLDFFDVQSNARRRFGEGERELDVHLTQALEEERGQMEAGSKEHRTQRLKEEQGERDGGLDEHRAQQLEERDEEPARSGNAEQDRTLDDDAVGVDVFGISLVASTEERSTPQQDEKARGDAPLRERILNDMVSCGTVATLNAGFGLGLFNREFRQDSFEFAAGMVAFLCVQLCTFSAMAAAIIYRRVNRMDDKEAEQFAQRWTFVCKVCPCSSSPLPLANR